MSSPSVKKLLLLTVDRNIDGWRVQPVEVAGLQLDCVECTQQVEDIIVYLDKSGIVKTLLQVITDENQSISQARPLHRVLFNKAKVVHLDSCGKYISMVTEDMHLYVSKHFGGGNFSSNYKVDFNEFGHNPSGLMSYVKLFPSSQTDCVTIVGFFPNNAENNRVLERTIELATIIKHFFLNNVEVANTNHQRTHVFESIGRTWLDKVRMSNMMVR